MTAITTIGLLPVLLVILASSLELGALRIVEARVHAAADLAVPGAGTDQADPARPRPGRLQPPAAAAAMAPPVHAAPPQRAPPPGAPLGPGHPPLAPRPETTR